MSQTWNGGVGDLGANERHELLASKRRRLALDILEEETSTVHIETLAGRIAAKEGDADSTPEETVERIALALHHTHLPKMASAGVLEYDPETHRIEPPAVV